jgi:hypothetical protein
MVPARGPETPRQGRVRRWEWHPGRELLTGDQVLPYGRLSLSWCYLRENRQHTELPDLVRLTVERNEPRHPLTHYDHRIRVVVTCFSLRSARRQSGQR